jgi:capsid assembly protease
MRDDDTATPLTLGRSLWAIHPDVLPRLVEARRSVRALQGFARTSPVAQDDESARAGRGVAVLPLTGVITPRGSLLSLLFGGGGGLVDFRASFREAMSSPDVGAIVLDVDSPGGLIDLVPETAEEIRAARGVKPIVAVANTLAASGAYWIASQADELVITPSGSAGSVGVYMVHEDWSGFNEKEGIQPTYISAGKYKVEGNPDEPLSEEAQADWQREVDDLYAMFVEAVAQGRGVSTAQVRDGYGEGRTLLAHRALGAGMVDRVATLEETVYDLLASSRDEGANARVALRFSTNAGLHRPSARSETPTPPAGDETDPKRDEPQPEPVIPVEPPPEPDVPLAEPDPETRAAIAALLTT